MNLPLPVPGALGETAMANCEAALKFADEARRRKRFEAESREMYPSARSKRGASHRGKLK